mmetsp:Transcript_12883/g.31300  ORF Transcript_12883/g.31300 Transcript_12883/m.31300 type:complete len:217 (+) Transcript_12883:560-1210(+)
MTPRETSMTWRVLSSRTSRSHLILPHRSLTALRAMSTRWRTTRPSARPVRRARSRRVGSSAPPATRPRTMTRTARTRAWPVPPMPSTCSLLARRPSPSYPRRVPRSAPSAHAWKGSIPRAARRAAASACPAPRAPSALAMVRTCESSRCPSRATSRQPTMPRSWASAAQRSHAPAVTPQSVARALRATCAPSAQTATSCRGACAKFARRRTKALLS